MQYPLLASHADKPEFATVYYISGLFHIIYFDSLKIMINIQYNLSFLE